MSNRSASSPDLDVEAQRRTTAPAARGHDHHDHDHDHDHADHPHDHEHAFEWSEMTSIAVVALAAVAVWFKVWEPIAGIDLIGAAALLIGGWPIYREALENLLARRMTMELSMSIAIIAAAAISEFFTALIITLFVLVAEVLEGMTVARGRHAIRDLVEFLPREVTVRRGGRVMDIPLAALAGGDAVLVNPGGRIPADGEVIAGHSFVDQSRITGESIPVEKPAGAHVFAGSINQSGALEIRADRIGRDTSYGKIIEAVEHAERSRAPVQRLADRMAGYLVYFALGAAVLTFIITRDIRSTISVVIVAGACGIAAGTPLAILGAIGRAARSGAIVKGGLYLEQLGQVDTVVLDKTGTLTYGRPEVRALLPAAGADEMRLLDAAAAAELRSEHPLGRTIVAHALALGRTPVEPQDFAYTPGRGIRAAIDGETVLVGNMALMSEHGIGVPARLLDRYPEASEVYVARGGVLLGASRSPTPYARRPGRPSRPSTAWGSRPVCSPATPPRWRARLRPNWASPISRRSCCPKTSAAMCSARWRPGAAWQWWATASTTRRRWWRRRWAWPWGRAPTLPVRAPTWCCSAMICSSLPRP